MNWNGDKSIKMNLDKTGKSDKTGTTNKDIKYDDILLNGNAGTTNKIQALNRMLNIMIYCLS